MVTHLKEAHFAQPSGEMVVIPGIGTHGIFSNSIVGVQSIFRNDIAVIRGYAHIRQIIAVVTVARDPILKLDTLVGRRLGFWARECRSPNKIAEINRSLVIVLITTLF